MAILPDCTLILRLYFLWNWLRVSFLAHLLSFFFWFSVLRYVYGSIIDVINFFMYFLSLTSFVFQINLDLSLLFFQ